MGGTGIIIETAITAVIDSGIAQGSGSIFTVRTTDPIAITTKNLIVATTIITAEEGIQATTTTAAITRAMTEGVTMATIKDTVGIRRITTITE